MASIDDLPDEILSRIFTIGCDQYSIPSVKWFYKATSNEDTETPILKPFGRLAQRVCRRWRLLVVAGGNRHLFHTSVRCYLPPPQIVSIGTNGSRSYRSAPMDHELTRIHHHLNHSAGSDLVVEIVHSWTDDISHQPTGRIVRGPADLNAIASFGAHVLNMLVPHAPRLYSLFVGDAGVYILPVLLRVLQATGDTPRLASLDIDTLNPHDSIRVPLSATILGYSPPLEHLLIPPIPVDIAVVTVYRELSNDINIVSQ